MTPPHIPPEMLAQVLADRDRGRAVLAQVSALLDREAEARGRIVFGLHKGKRLSPPLEDARARIAAELAKGVPVPADLCDVPAYDGDPLDAFRSSPP